MPAYYNEIDPFAAAWLRNLIAAGHIAPGDVDERSIAEVSPDDLKGYEQCHFFAGIGGWSFAARLAGIPDDFPLWTGSCPCQPFSSAGKRRGTDDERHLWPEFYRLIAECRPAIVAGEQVGRKDGLRWLDGVAIDLESSGYAFGAAHLCGSLAGQPERSRLFWVAHSDGHRERRMQVNAKASRIPQAPGRSVAAWAAARGLVSGSDGLPNSMGRRRGYGNAISPQVAAEFLIAALEAIEAS